MLPSLNQLADGSDDAAVKARAATVALLLGGIGLQDGFYTNHSITSVIGRLEGAEGADVARIEPALTALKHLRDVLETRDQLSREVTTERTSSDPIDINAADEEVPSGSSSFSRPQSSLGGSTGGGGGGSFTFGGGGGFTFGGGGGSFGGGNPSGGGFGGDATDELRRLSLADEVPAPMLQGRPSGDFGSGGFAAAGVGGTGFGGAGFSAANHSGGRASGEFGPGGGFGGQRADSFGAASFGSGGFGGRASGDLHGAAGFGNNMVAGFGGRASLADFGGRQASGGAPSSPYGSPSAASYRRRTMDSHSPGASMRMLQSDLRKVRLTDDTQDDFYGSL